MLKPAEDRSADQEECQACDGMGGYDASKDCEVYDDWQECPECGGTGMVEIGHFEKIVFDPKRDAFQPGD